jgi:RNA polymerase sigma factor (sigma-70 family)
MLVGCVFGGLLLLVPESPRCLLKLNRRAEALVILERIGGADAARRELAAIEETLREEPGRWRELLRPGCRRAPVPRQLFCHVFPFRATLWAVMNTMAMQETELLGDEELVGLCLSGDRDAFGRIVERYQSLVCALAYSACGDLARSEDLAQETFIAVLRGRERYEPRALVRTYLYAIALKQLAAERRRMTRSTAEPAVEAATSSDPDAALWVRQAVEKLDVDSREIVLLREYEQLSYAEIALLIRIPVNTVRSRLFRARMELKSLLVEQRKPQ